MYYSTRTDANDWIVRRLDHEYVGKEREVGRGIAAFYRSYPSTRLPGEQNEKQRLVFISL